VRLILVYITFGILLLSNLDVFGDDIKQQPDSLNNNETETSFSPFKEELIIETKNVNDTSTEKLIVKKQRERAMYFQVEPKINRWDTLEFSDVNIDSIDFIFTKGIYKEQYLMNFMEQITVLKPINKKPKNKNQVKNNNTAHKDKTSVNKKILSSSKKITNINNNEIFPNEWSFTIIIVILLLFLMIRFYKQRSLKNLFMSIINYQVALKNYKENNSLSIKINFIITTIFIINISFFITLSCYKFNYFPFAAKGILLFIYILIIVFLFYLIKYIFYKVLAFIFNITNQVKEFYYNTFVFNKVFGIILIPLSVILPFIRLENVIFLHKAVIVLVIIMLVWKMLYSIYVAFRLKLSILYLILYLCALEILPSLAIVKFLLS